MVRESGGRCLDLGGERSGVMVVSGKEVPPGCGIAVDGTELKQADGFWCLGAIVAADGRWHGGIGHRRARARSTFQRMRGFLCGRSMSMETGFPMLRSSWFYFVDVEYDP